jgi:hypothetical protein
MMEKFTRERKLVPVTETEEASVMSLEDIERFRSEILEMTARQKESRDLKFTAGKKEARESTLEPVKLMEDQLKLLDSGERDRFNEFFNEVKALERLN